MPHIEQVPIREAAERVVAAIVEIPVDDRLRKYWVKEVDAAEAEIRDVVEPIAKGVEILDLIRIGRQDPGAVSAGLRDAADWIEQNCPHAYAPTLRKAAAMLWPQPGWRETGDQDPHGGRYDGPREQLCGGHLTDDQVAYQTAMLMRNDLAHEAVLGTAKDRIRWLSRRVAALEAAAAPTHCTPDAGEPAFVLLGRDPQAPHLVEVWAEDRERIEPETDKARSARAIAAAMVAYKRANPDKGLPASAYAALATLPEIPRPDPAEIYARLDGDSLDAICEVIGSPKLYSAGKSTMRAWFLGRLRRLWNLPEPAATDTASAVE